MPSQVLLLTKGRTGCHVLERMLSKQPNTTYLQHPFAPARPQQSKVLGDVSLISDSAAEQTRKNYTDLVQAGVITWQSAFEAAQEAKQTLFMHDHPHFALDPNLALKYATNDWNTGTYHGGTNCTLIPDELLLRPGTSVIFNIRHPSHTVRAAYTGLRDLEYGNSRANVIVVTTLRWQRELYDWYMSKGVTPIVVDAEDYMTSPEFVRKLCEEAGLSAEHAIFSWPKATDEEIEKMHPVMAKLLWSLLHSEGLEPAFYSKALAFEEEMKKWRVEFGKEEARFLEELVESSMPHYEYLRERRLML